MFPSSLASLHCCGSVEMVGVPKQHDFRQQVSVGTGTASSVSKASLHVVRHARFDLLSEARDQGLHLCCAFENQISRNSEGLQLFVEIRRALHNLQFCS